MKKLILLLLALASVLALTACAAKILHCDGCGKEVSVKADNQMDEDWILFCDECHEELFGEDGLVTPSK